MIAENQRFLDFTGVSRFHDAGYTGKGTIFASGEQFPDDELTSLGHKCLTPLPGYPAGKDPHALHTALSFFLVAPDATLARLPFTNAITSDFYKDAIPVIKKFGILGMFASFENSDAGPLDQEDAVLDQLPNFFFTCSIGNHDEQYSNPAAFARNIYAVGAYYLSNTPPQAIPAYFSALSTDLDWVAPTMFWVHTLNGNVQVNGTSFANPWQSGMASIVQDFFQTKSGNPLPHRSVAQFFNDNSVDLLAPGKDTKTGNGYVVLPDPKTIDIKKYTGEGIVVPVTLDNTYGDHSDWSTDAVKYVVDNKIINGDGNGNFRWQDNITREELAQILYNMSMSK
jgi:hypothetical protein